jgi:hypothetical protein
MYTKLKLVQYSMVVLVALSIGGLWYGWEWIQPTPSLFTITQTSAHSQEIIVSVQIDNCHGQIQKQETYRYPNNTGSVGVENLVANGGEPFRTIRKSIAQMYGNPREKLTLTVPAHTKRIFTISIIQYTYRGIVHGESLDKDKIDVRKELTYYYPFNADIQIKSHVDASCS